MLKNLLFPLAALLAAALPLSAQTMETWVTSQGAMFEATIKTVVPGQATFVLKDGREQNVPLQDLSERSRVKLAEALGFGATPVAPAAAPATASTAAPATPAPATTSTPAPTSAPMAGTPMEVKPVDGTAIDVSDATQILAKIGQQGIVVGTVSEVATLGASGHRLIKFENSTFNVFISKQILDQSTDWVLDDLPGKRLQVSGKLETYRDAPQIRGTTPTQLTRVQ